MKKQIAFVIIVFVVALIICGKIEGMWKKGLDKIRLMVYNKIKIKEGREKNEADSDRKRTDGWYDKKVWFWR